MIEFKQYTVTATAAKLTTVMGWDERKFLKGFDAILSSGANTCYFGGSDVTNVPANAGGKSTATLGYSIGPFAGDNCISSDLIYIVGTAADVLLITVVT